MKITNCFYISFYRGVLDEQDPKILSYSMPVIWLLPCMKNNIKEEGRYK